MAISRHAVSIPKIPSAGSADQAAVHEAALEWSMLAPIIIRSIEDVKSRPVWSKDLTPFNHQYENLFTFCRRLPVSLVADDVGLGKTVTAGLILSELMTRQRVRRTLVLCPKILCEQWESELTRKFGIESAAPQGIAALRAAVNSAVPVVITTYDSALHILGELEPNDFDMLILDEAHKLRNLHGTANPPRRAIAVRDALKQKVFAFVLMLTATPLQNRLWDIYSLIDLLSLGRDHSNPFGAPVEFRYGYIDTDYPGDRMLLDHRKADFRAIVRDYMVRTRRLDAELPFPERVVHTETLPLTAKEAVLFDAMATILPAVTGLEQASLAKALLSSPQAFAAQLENMAATRSQFEKAAERARQYADTNPLTAKLSAVQTLVDSLRKQKNDDWRLLIFTERRETQEAIGRWCVQAGLRHGFIRGGATEANQRAINNFVQASPRINCLISTDSGAEGVNLQVCNHVVNFDLPWNPMRLEQRIGRIQRLASPYKYVFVTNLVLDHPADAHVVGLLMEKLASISCAIDDIEAVLEFLADEPAGDAGESFESRVRTLVVSAFLKRDVKRDAALIAANIDKAQRTRAEREHELDELVGVGGDAIDSAEESDTSDVHPPDLDYHEPRLSADEFVLRAKAFEGDLNRDTEGFYRLSRPDGSTELFTLLRPPAGRAAAQSRRDEVRSYVEGSPPFQQLVSHWAKPHHFVVDKLYRQPHALESLIRKLLCHTCLSVNSVRVLSRAPALSGEIVVRAQAANGVDRYEKLIHIGEPAAAPRDGDLVQASPLGPSDMPPGVEDAIRARVADDPDIQAFVAYYDAKRRIDTIKARRDRDRLARVRVNYTTKLGSEVVAVYGIQTAVVELRVSYRIGDSPEYVSPFTLDTAVEQFVQQPQWNQCEVSGQSVPEQAIAACAVTGKAVCKHLLKQSSVSGRFAIPEHAVVCGSTGGTLLADEAGTSDFSGTTVDRRLLRTSGVSGRRGFGEEVVQCAFTLTNALIDEAVQSSVSGQKIRRDKAVDCGEGRWAHASELQKCEITGELVLPSDLGQSDFSGKWVARSLLALSEREPYRRGLSTEFAVCAITGKRVLQDEVVVSVVSGKTVVPEHAVASASSGRVALPDEAVKCAATGRVLLPDEVVRSDVSAAFIEKGQEIRSEIGGRVGLPQEAQRCAITGALVLCDELLSSCTSSLSFRADQACTLTQGGICHKSEARQCSISGEWLPISHGAPSSVSGVWVASRFLLVSEKPPGRKGLKSETVRCAVTGRLLLSDEVAASISGTVGDSSLLTHSEVSGGAAFPAEMVTCAMTGKRALAAELATSALSGKKVLPSLLVPSEATGRLVLPDELEKCQVTGSMVVADELVPSQVTGKRFRADEAVTLADGRHAHSSEARGCDRTGDLIALGEGAPSDVSGAWVGLRHLERSEKSSRRGLPSEIRTCGVTGRRLLLDEVAVSATGMTADKELLTKSDVSGRVGFAAEMSVCEESGKKGLPDELGASAVTGRTVDKRLLVPSPVSGRLGAASEFAACDFTGTQVLVDELAVSAISGKRFRRDQIVTGADGTVGHASEFVTCASSKRLIPARSARASDVSGIVVADELLVASDKPPRRRGLADECVQCAVTGKRLLIDETGISEVSGRRGDRDLLLRSPFLGKKVFADELQQCTITGIRLLPEEMGTCSVTGARVAPDALVKSAVSDRRALIAETVTCDFSHARLLRDETSTSEISGRRYRLDQEARSFDGKRGHISEFRECTYSGRLLAPEQGRSSAVSGRWAAHEHLRPSARSPDRYGLPDELVRCEVTGQTLLRDEVAPSQVSGRVGDRSLLVQSPRSHQWGFRDEMVQCEESGQWLLPSEIAQCFISARRVDAALLQPYGAQGGRALARLLGTCHVTGARLPLTDLVECEVTGNRVSRADTAICVETGRRAVRSSLLQCDFPAGFIVNDPQVIFRSSKSGRVGSRKYLRRCYWSAQMLLPDEVRQCRHTNLVFDVDLIEDESLRLLQSGLSGKPTPGFADRKDLLPWLHTLCTGLPHPPTAAKAAPSPDGLRQLIIAESKRWPWQPTLRIGLLAKVAASPAHLGRGVWGIADRSGWTLQGFIEPATNAPKASGK